MQQTWRRFASLAAGCILAGWILASLAACAPGTGGVSLNGGSATSALPTSTLSPSSTNTQPRGTLKGTVEASPGCPVEHAEQPCPPQPTPNRLVLIETPAGALVAQVTTDQHGQFVVQLAPGVYELRVAPGAAQFPIQRKPQSVTIAAGQTVQVTVELDSGIR